MRRRRRIEKKLVFDAGALTLRYIDDVRVREFFDAVASHESRGLVSGVNLAEFYYKTCRILGKQTADNWYYRALESGLSIVHGEELDRLAGVEKCRKGSELSLADCYALALAKSENALLLTTDSVLASVADIRSRYVAP